MLEAEKNYVMKAKAGDASAFGSLYDHYSGPIYRFIAIRVSRQEEAEDLLHEVFLSAWQKLPSYQEQGFPFSSWLYRIARNRVIDHYRTKREHLNVDDPEIELSGRIVDEKSKSADSEMDIRLSLDKVMAAISRLTQDQQEVLILRFVEDLEPKEIAKILNKKEGAVRILQYRAVQALKKILSDAKS